MKNTTSLTEEWIEERPFLKEIGEFHIAIEEIVDRFPVEKDVEMPDWDLLKEDFQSGIPVFKSTALNIPIQETAGKLFNELTSIATNEALPEKFREQCAILQEKCTENEQLAEQIITAILTENHKQSKELLETNELDEGLVWFFAWTAVAEALAPYRENLIKWQEDTRWERGYCPTCGSLPSFAQLKRGKGGRKRHLSCSCCKTEWTFKRIGCPYCDNTDQHSLAIFEVEEEPDFRLDVCNSCNSYLKIYLDRGKEAIYLADWATIHLDILCKEKGYIKMGTPLLTE